MAEFNKVLVVGRNKDGTPRVLSEIPVAGGAAAKHVLCVPNFVGGAQAAHQLAHEVARKFEEPGGGEPMK